MKRIDAQDKLERKLGVLIVGLNGAVSTTFLAGVIAIRKGMAEPVGSLTQMGRIDNGRSNGDGGPIREFVPIASLDNLVFGGWDIRDENCYESAVSAGVLNKEDLRSVQSELEQIRPMRGVFDRNYVKNITGSWTKNAQNKYAYVNQIRQDIRDFKAGAKLEDVVMIWLASTEIYRPILRIHDNLDDFEKAIENNHADISPCMLYAYAAIAENAPFINGAPNLGPDIPALIDYSRRKGVPVAGKDMKTGQTLLKTAIAPMLKARMLGLKGWYSMNILGNGDGSVLDDPQSFKAKQESKLSVLDGILKPEQHSALYGNFHHKVRIDYYPPSGDNKESWDNIDIFGWLGYPMQIKIDFLCRDSILAAPIVLDLVLFMDLARRCGLSGPQEWLSFYFKSPMGSCEHDLFIQLRNLNDALRNMRRILFSTEDEGENRLMGNEMRL
jgi:myo-inositol-1-phosphate synthase